MNSYIILSIIAIYFGILLLIAWITGRKSTRKQEERSTGFITPLSNPVTQIGVDRSQFQFIVKR